MLFPRLKGRNELFRCKVPVVFTGLTYYLALLLGFIVKLHDLQVGMFRVFDLDFLDFDLPDIGDFTTFFKFSMTSRRASG